MFTLLQLSPSNQRYYHRLHIFDKRLLGRADKPRNQTFDDDPHISMGVNHLLYSRSEQSALKKSHVKDRRTTADSRNVESEKLYASWVSYLLDPQERFQRTALILFYQHLIRYNLCYNAGSIICLSKS